MAPWQQGIKGGAPLTLTLSPAGRGDRTCFRPEFPWLELPTAKTATAPVAVPREPFHPRSVNDPVMTLAYSRRIGSHERLLLARSRRIHVLPVTMSTRKIAFGWLNVGRWSSR